MELGPFEYWSTLAPVMKSSFEFSVTGCVLVDGTAFLLLPLFFLTNDFSDSKSERTLLFLLSLLLDTDPVNVVDRGTG